METAEIIPVVENNGYLIIGIVLAVFLFGYILTRLLGSRDGQWNAEDDVCVAPVLRLMQWILTGVAIGLLTI